MKITLKTAAAIIAATKCYDTNTRSFYPQNLSNDVIFNPENPVNPDSKLLLQATF